MDAAQSEVYRVRALGLGVVLGPLLMLMVACGSGEDAPQEQSVVPGLDTSDVVVELDIPSPLDARLEEEQTDAQTETPDVAPSDVGLPCVSVSDCPGEAPALCRVWVCETVTGQCVPAPAPDGDPCDIGATCTTSTCDAGACVGAAKSCDDGDSCTTDACDPETGACVTSALSCDDGNACTQDTCNPNAGCAHAATPCDDGDACTVDLCDAAQGCVAKPFDCGDGDPCTEDVCKAATGCANTTVEGCVGCSQNEDCADGNGCTSDLCVDEACQWQNLTVSCSDDNACTGPDTCADGSCEGAFIDCDDASECTIDSCDPEVGCKHDEVVCDDGEPCTIDLCDATTGCTTAPTLCDDGDECTVDTCEPSLGCRFVKRDCDDGDGCTTDGCDPDSGCTHAAVACDDGVACTADTCVATTSCVVGSFTGGRCLFAVATPPSAPQAGSDACAQAGGQLARLYTVSDLRAARLEASIACGPRDNALFGLTDVAMEGSFQYADGTVPAVTAWAPGEPNDFEVGEDYVELRTDGLWNDVGSNSTRPCSLCERQPEPANGECRHEPATRSDAVWLSESFDGIPAGWTVDAAWSVGPAIGFSINPNIVEPSLDVTPGSDNGIAGNTIGGLAQFPAGSSYLTSPSFDTSDSSGPLFLSFWHQSTSYSLEAALAVSVRRPDQSWYELWRSPSGLFQSNSWTRMVLDLRSFKGPEMQIRFEFTSTGAPATVTLGWSLDDVVVSSAGNMTSYVAVEGFSEGSGWSTEGDWQIGPAVASNGAAEGQEDPGTDATGTPSRGVAGTALGAHLAVPTEGWRYLTSPTWALGYARRGLTLEFDRWLNLSKDGLTEASIEGFDGESWRVLWSSTGEQDAAWTRVRLDLSPIANDAFKVRFGYRVALAAPAVSGWNIDNVRILDLAWPACADESCAVAPEYCDDGNGCTLDACDQVTGYCRGHELTACPDDGDACTVDTCSLVEDCHRAKTCIDGDHCTVDDCQPATGCSYPSESCDDGDSCTADSCSSTFPVCKRGTPTAAGCYQIVFGIPGPFGNPKTIGIYEARAECEAVGMRLARVRTAEQNDAIQAILNSTLAGKGLGGSLAFLSGTDQRYEGRWVWPATLEDPAVAFDYTNWADGEPYGGPAQTIMLMLPDGTWGSGGPEGSYGVGVCESTPAPGCVHTPLASCP